MTTETPAKRHSWTKDELAHLNRTVSHSKSKGAAFEKIANEMGLTKTAVAGTYYNHHRTKAKKDGQDTAQKAAIKSSSDKVEVWRSSKSPVQIGRPFDFTGYSERELAEVSQAITFEVNRRIEALRELESMFSKT